MKNICGIIFFLAIATTQYLSAEPFMIPEGPNPNNMRPPPPHEVVALLSPTKGNRAQGIVVFTNTPDGVKIVAEIDFLEPGKHGFHIHEYADCSAPDGTSTGGHFNPKGCRHGGPDSAVRHVGDLGNVVADETGHAHYERVDHMIQLDGPYSIIGHSIVVHANADDYVSQPAGNSGGRVACGVIE